MEDNYRVRLYGEKTKTPGDMVFKIRIKFFGLDGCRVDVYVSDYDVCVAKAGGYREVVRGSTVDGRKHKAHLIQEIYETQSKSTIYIYDYDIETCLYAPSKDPLSEI